MKILVTGNKGFVGSETQKVLEKEGHEVIGYDLMDGRDIRDREQFETVVKEEKPDRCLHLAAVARFSDADANPDRAYNINVTGTKNVVDVCMKYHVPLIFASTGSATMPLDNYEAPFDDEIPARGNSVYGVTKAEGEYLVKKHTPHIILRYAHLYGPDKRYHGLIGGFLTRIERGLAPKLYGGKQSNSFTYIKDIARANLLALTAPWDSFDQTYNIGSPEELTAEDAGKIICEVFGYDGEIEKHEGRTVDPSRFCINTKKADTMLGFKTEFDFRTGLEAMKKELDLRK